MTSLSPKLSKNPSKNLLKGILPLKDLFKGANPTSRPGAGAEEVPVERPKYAVAT